MVIIYKLIRLDMATYESTLIITYIVDIFIRAKI